MEGPEFTGVIVALYWNEKEKQFTQLQYVLGSEFDECEESVTDTFDLSPKLPNEPTPGPTSSDLSVILPFWIKQCANEHASSCACGPPEWLPKRLIDTSSRSGPRFARIFDTEGLDPAQFPYITLSNSPLDEDFSYPTTANIEAWKERFALLRFPKLFQLTTKATIAIGFRYLWIKELCVLPESTEDVLTEVATRDAIYGNSSITITAASVQALDNGLQSTHSRLYNEPASIELMYDGPFGISFRSYTAIRQNVWASDMFGSQIAHDGGHFVKQLYMRRNLHFGENQLYYKCRTSMACEMFPKGNPLSMPQHPTDDVDNAIQRQRKHLEISEIELWHRFVQKFSQKCFHDPRTRLLDIACFAAQAGGAMEARYVAGLWHESLIDDMLWYVDGTPCGRPKEYCAPTWSWASVSGTVTYIPSSELFGTQFVTIIRAETKPVIPEFSTGPVVGGHIWLRGFLIEIPKLTFSNIRGHCVAGCFYPDDRDDANNASYFCLPLRKQLTAQGVYLCGLVLQDNKNTWGIVYRRVGFFRCKDSDALHLLGQKVRGRSGSTYYSYEKYVDQNIDGQPVADEITII